MEANAPERIWIDLATDLPKLSGHIDKDSVEYIRADVFIKKACEFLKSYRQETYDGLGYIAGIVNDKTIEEFKDYLQNESEMPKKP